MLAEFAVYHAAADELQEPGASVRLAETDWSEALGYAVNEQPLLVLSRRTLFREQAFRAGLQLHVVAPQKLDAEGNEYDSPWLGANLSTGNYEVSQDYFFRLALLCSPVVFPH